MTIKMYSLQPNSIEDLSRDPLPMVLSTWHGNRLALPATGTHFGYVFQGHPKLSHHGDTESYTLHPGMYFSLPGAGQIGREANSPDDPGHSSGIVVTRLAHHGVFSLGGPIESTGRFAYINEGTNSLLIPPTYRGDPCLHALFFPPYVDQTLHTHPSYRIGIVVSGNGECETPDGIMALVPGTGLVIPTNDSHKFRTGASPLAMVMFHPDSDIGFTHQHNPMLNRTFVAGVSAAQLPELQTKLSAQQEKAIAVGADDPNTGNATP